MEAVAMAVMVTHMDHVAMTIVVMVVMEHLKKATMHQVDTDQAATGGDNLLYDYQLLSQPELELPILTVMPSQYFIFVMLFIIRCLKISFFTAVLIFDSFRFLKF